MQRRYCKLNPRGSTSYQQQQRLIFKSPPELPVTPTAPSKPPSTYNIRLSYLALRNIRPHPNCYRLPLRCDGETPLYSRNISICSLHCEAEIIRSPTFMTTAIPTMRHTNIPSRVPITHNKTVQDAEHVSDVYDNDHNNIHFDSRTIKGKRNPRVPTRKSTIAYVDSYFANRFILI